VLLRLSFLLFLTTAVPSSAIADEDPPRILFGGPVTHAEAWDDERLWIVSRGRLLAIDLCGEAPRPVHLAEGDARPGRRRPRDLDKELMIAGLDEGTWDDRVLEDFRDDEGFGEESGKGRHDAFRNEGGPGLVLGLEKRGAVLAVTRDREEWLCLPAEAACRSRAHQVTSIRQPAPPAPDDQITERASAHGRWLTSGAGVWFAPRAGLDLARVCAELGRPFEPFAVTVSGGSRLSDAWRWLPEVTLLGARRAVIWSDGRHRSELLLMILLSFPGGAAPFSPRGDLAEEIR